MCHSQEERDALEKREASKKAREAAVFLIIDEVPMTGHTSCHLLKKHTLRNLRDLLCHIVS